MRVLVTGGLGFIGRHLVRALIENGHEVRVIDRAQLLESTGMVFDAGYVQADLTDPYKYTENLKAFRPEVVYHLAAQTSVPTSVKFPLADLADNVDATLHLIDVLREIDFKGRIVYTSTCAVYGDKGNVEINESMMPAPMSPYAVSKLAAEQYLLASGLNVNVLRLGNVYGPGQGDSGEAGVVSVFLRQARDSECRMFTIHGTGHQIRDFVYVADVVEALMLSAQHRESGLTVNVASGYTTSILFLCNCIARLLDIDPIVCYTPRRAGDIQMSRLDTRRLLNVLGYRPRYGILEGLKAMLGLENKEVLE